jgi:BMFP domain-containing protein YqiC
MFDPKQFDEIASKLFSALPTSLQNLEKDLQAQFKEILQATFAKMDLITRDEFDVQCKVLARTRDKVEQLQEQLNQIMIEKENKQ